MAVALLPAVACESAPPTPVLVVEGDTIPLPPGARIHDVDVRVADATEFEPGRVAAHPGDVVRFTTGDGRGHALAIDASVAGDSAAVLLEHTGQRRSPPLLDTGAIWIVNLDGAPAGAYRVTCLVHPGEGLALDLSDR